MTRIPTSLLSVLICKRYKRQALKKVIDCAVCPSVLITCSLPPGPLIWFVSWFLVLRRHMHVLLYAELLPMNEGSSDGPLVFHQLSRSH